MPHNDNGYKLMFSQPDMVRDLLMGFVHQDWVKDVDFSTLTPVPTERITGKLSRRYNDIVWKVRLHENDLYLCIMLEFQSIPDRFMSLRIMTYLGMLYQHLQESRQLLPGGLLPPVLPIVLYNGRPKWRHATDIHDLVAHYSDDLSCFSPRLQFLLINERDYTEETLCAPHMKETKNLVSALFRLENADSDNRIYDVLSELLSWLELPGQQPLSRAMAAWYNRVFRDSKKEAETLPEFEDLTEVHSMLHITVKEWRREARRQGLAEGRAEGKAEGRAEGRAEGKTETMRQVALAMFRNGEPMQKIITYTGLSEDAIKSLTR